MTSNRPKIGDVYEFETPKGLAYFQFTHLTPEDRFPIIRVLPGVFETRPHGIRELVFQRELYFAFYVLPYALKAKQITLVSNEPVPAWAVKFPVMRRSAAIIDGFSSWMIGPASTPFTLEGTKTMVHVKRLTPEQKEVAMLGEIVSHPGLVEKIVRGWTPERAEELAVTGQAKSDSSIGTQSAMESSAEFVDHYLYFSRKINAQKASKRLRAKGWFAEVRLGSDKAKWLVLAKQPVLVDDETEDIRPELSVLAGELGGEYDGWGSTI